VEKVREAEDVAAMDSAINDRVPAVTEDPALLCGAEGIDALIEVTGSIGYAAEVVLAAIEQRKHVILMNAELDGTVGPILKVRADDAGVVLTACDGDQPGVQMNLYRFVRGIGVTPLLCGNIKGLHDPSRNPTTQQGFAEQWGQDVHMVTSFADGTKISFEQAIVANATGMRVAQRGMLGYDTPGPIEEAASRFDVDELRELGGLVDYVVGATPSPGVFVLGTHDDPGQRHYLNLYKLGTGPLYTFYTPYHLCHFEVPLSVARAVLFGDPVLTPLERWPDLSGRGNDAGQSGSGFHPHPKLALGVTPAGGVGERPGAALATARPGWHKSLRMCVIHSRRMSLLRNGGA
jgi:predicted homoserine dehydrogenase-like protein